MRVKTSTENDKRMTGALLLLMLLTGLYSEALTLFSIGVQPVDELSMCRHNTEMCAVWLSKGDC